MPATDHDYLTAAQVRARYGNVSKMTLHRWRNDPELGFPQPEPIRTRNYWRVDQLDAWDKARGIKVAAKRASAPVVQAGIEAL